MSELERIKKEANEKIDLIYNFFDEIDDYQDNLFNRFSNHSADFYERKINELRSKIAIQDAVHRLSNAS